MVTLTVKKNPFNCEGREVHQIEYVPGQSISEYCRAYAASEVDFVYGLNGKVVDGDAIPQDGDYITVCPVVGKNILGTILTIGLMVFTGSLFPAGAAFGAFGIKAGTFLAGLVQASVMMIGGALISMLCPTQKADTTVDLSTSDPIYSWGNIDSQTEQGGALAKTYGTYKTSGTILSRHVTTDGKNQYLNLLLTGGEGPIDSISDIRINDNPISNYDGIEVETRLGTNDQAVIANFNDSFADQGLSYELELNGGYSTQLSESTAAQGLEVTLECSNGLYYMNDDSSLGTASVSYQLQYRPSGGSWVDWGTFTLSGADSTAVRSVQRIDNLPAGQYEVRAQCTAKSGTSTRYSTRIFWTQLTSIIYDDFIHPGKVLVGIKALATSQLSGSTINVTWLQTRSTVPVWNGSAYVDKPANNAAWAAYDKLHGCRRLKNINTGIFEYVVGNVPASQIIYDDFAVWADHFAALGLSYNNIVTEATDLWDALSAPETFGRGKVIQRGTRYGCVCDKPRTPVQMFTVGNIANDSYSKDILPITDRANCIEISFVNKDKNYTKDAFCVYSDDYDTDGVIKSPTQITLAGCVDYAQAYQHGKYLLRLNKLELRTITLGADIDAIGCQYGDLVLVQHDVPQWGEGGRIKSATATTLTLDREVAMESGQSYGVIVRLSDDSLVTKPVITVAGTTRTVTVASAFATVPKAYDIYSFGLINKIAKPFVVIDVDRDDDKRATISGIEYVEAVYEESLDAPVVQYSGLAVRQINIAASEVFPRPSDGTANLSVSFNWPRDSRVAGAKILANGSVVKSIGIGASGGQSINVNASGIYTITVNVVDMFGTTIATGSVAYKIGIEHIADVDGDSLTSYYDNNRLIIACNAVSDYRTIQYEWRLGLTWANGLQCGRTNTPRFAPPSDGMYWVAACYGNIYSANPQSVVVSGVVLPENILATLDEKAGGWSGTCAGGAYHDTDSGIILLSGATSFDDIPDIDAVSNLDFAGGAASAGTYQIAESNRIDIGTAALCNVSIIYDAVGDTINDDFDLVADVDSLTSWDGEYGQWVSATPQIRTAGNDGVFGEWKNLYSGQYNARIFDFRIVLASTNSEATVKLHDYKITVDVPDRVESGTHVLIPDTGATINYATPFNAVPGPNVVILDAESGDQLVLPKSQQTKTGFFVQITNGGSGVARYVNWIAKKY